MQKIKLITTVIVTIQLLSIAGCRQIFGDREQPEQIVSPSEQKAKFVFTSPTFRSVWKADEVMEIKWITSGQVNKVNIKLFRKSFLQFNLVLGLQNNGNYSWNIPANISPSLHYLIRIENYNNPEEYKLSERFIVE